MVGLKNWNFDSDSQVLACREQTRNLARQAARVRVQQWQEVVRQEQAVLQGMRTDTEIKISEAQAKRPLVAAAKLQGQINQQKLQQKRLALSEAQNSTAMAQDLLRASQASCQLSQQVMGEKLRTIAIQAQELRSGNEAKLKELSLTFGQLQSVKGGLMSL